MAMGVPCITSTLVNESLKAKDGEQVLIADDEVAYAEKIEYLLKNVHKAEHLAESGRAYVLNSFNWKHFTKNLVAFIRGESKSH
jgi:glycosyltransferase involved in cell wall biosynthesis